MWKWLGLAALAALAIVAVRVIPGLFAPESGSSFEAEGTFEPVVTTADMLDLFGILPTEADPYGLATGRTETGGYQFQLRSMKEGFELSPGRPLIVPGQGPVATIFAETWPRLEFNFRLVITEGERKTVIQAAVLTFDDGIEFRNPKTCRQISLGFTFAMKAHEFDTTDCREPTTDDCRMVKIEDPWLESVGAMPRAAAMCIVETEAHGKAVLSVYTASRAAISLIYRTQTCFALHRAIAASMPDKVAGLTNACLSFVQGEMMSSKTVLGMEVIPYKSDLGQSAP